MFRLFCFSSKTAPSFLTDSRVLVLRRVPSFLRSGPDTAPKNHFPEPCPCADMQAHRQTTRQAKYRALLPESEVFLLPAGFPPFPLIKDIVW